jgi:hypothetical protein
MSMLCCIYSPTVLAFSNQGLTQQMPMDFEAELEEANKAIEEYVANLSPEEQAEFNRQVEEMAQMFEGMSEEDFEKFLGEMFTEEQLMEPNPFEISQPEVEEVVEVILSADDKKKIETAVKVVDDIINQTNLFMVIVNSSPELPNRITRWGAKGEILNWQNASDWDKLKIELDAFVQMLYKTLEQDLTTKKYKYLFDVIADEGLYNNLIQLQTELNTLLPTINIPEFNIQKLSAESKTVIKDVLGKYTEGLYLLAIPQAIEKIFQKYAPEEEKIRAAEEAATKKAFEAQKGVRTPAAKTEAGIEGEDMGYGGYDSGYYGGDYGYSPYDSYGGYGGDYGYSPDYGSYGGSDYGSGRSGGGSSRGGDGGDYESAGRGTSAEKDKDKTKKGKDKDKTKFVPSIKIERAIADIKGGLADIIEAMTPSEETPEIPTNLANLAATINDKDNIDITLASSTLRMVDKKLSIIDEAIKKITDETLSADDLAHYKREISTIFTKNDKELKTLRDEIGKFELLKTDEEKEAAKEAKSTKTDVLTLSPEKQWAYFGEGTLPTSDENATLEKEIVTPTSLFEIKKKIDILFKDVEKFGKKQAPVIKKPTEPVIADIEE